MREEVRDTINKTNASGVDLLFTDIGLANTMLDRAEIASDSQTRNRNVEHARRAYDSVCLFLQKLQTSDDEQRTLTEKLLALEKRLRKLQPHSENP